MPAFSLWLRCWWLYGGGIVPVARLKHLHRYFIDKFEVAGIGLIAKRKVEC